MPDEILIVEDERIVALDIKTTLEKLGYKVSGISSSASEAMSACKEHSPDLVLMDIRLKGDTDGITAAQQIKDKFDLPVIYLTAHADESTLQRAKVTQPYGYVLKPFDPAELRVAIELALYRHGEEVGSEPKKVLNEVYGEFADKLASIECFSSWSSNALSIIANSSTLRSYPAGELIVFEGDRKTSGFVVLSGRVSLFKTSISGRELIVELLMPGEMLGLALAIEEQNFTFSARAQIESEVLLVPRSAVLELLESEPGLYRQFIELLSAHLSSSHANSRGLAHDKVEVRLASGILQMIPREDNMIVDDVFVTRKELAELSGTTVETAIRVTKALEREGLLDLSRQGVIKIKNLEGLHAIAYMD